MSSDRRAWRDPCHSAAVTAFKPKGSRDGWPPDDPVGPASISHRTGGPPPLLDEGVGAYVMKRGDPDAGALYVQLDRRTDGGPADPRPHADGHLTWRHAQGTGPILAPDAVERWRRNASSTPTSGLSTLKPGKAGTRSTRRRGRGYPGV